METQVGYVTEEEFWARYGNTKHRVELVDGEVIPKYGFEGPLSPTSGAHGAVVDNILFALNSHVRPLRLGRVFADPTAFVISERPKRIRCPDVAFVRADRLPTELPLAGPIRVVPDLAVEVVSPSEPMTAADAKLAMYRASGVRLAWKVVPGRRAVTVYDGDSEDTLGFGDHLSGGDVVPGFTLPVADVFAGVAEAPRRGRGSTAR